MSSSRSLLMGKKTTKFFVYGLKASEIMIETYIKDLTNRKQVFKVRKTEKSLLFKKMVCQQKQS